MKNVGHAMPIPFIIDNQQHRMADALNDLLGQSVSRPLDTAYFAVSGYRQCSWGMGRMALQ